jgi:LacI family transcriptional regulator
MESRKTTQIGQSGASLDGSGDGREAGEDHGAARELGSGARPTQRTIAKLTGLAVTTVSKALAGDAKIAPQTRERVARTAADIGYVPDRAAQRLRTGRTNVVALVLDPHSEMIGFSGSMISGLAERLRETPFHLVIMQHELGKDPIGPIKRIVRNRLADGVVFARTSAQDDRVSFLLENRFPFVTHGRTKLGPHAWVDYDNEAFARMAVERLAGRNRRRLAMIAPARQHMFAEHLVQGFQAAIASHAVTGHIPEDFDLHADPLLMRKAVSQMMDADDAPDGWICPGDIATLAVNAALKDHGLRPGVDVDVVSKATSPASELLRPDIDLIYEDLIGAGQTLADLIILRIEDGGCEGLTRLQSPQLHVPERLI